MRLIGSHSAVGLATVAATAVLSAGSAFGATQVARPTIAGFFPSSVSVGTTILISGTNLEGATSVALNGVRLTF